MADRSVIEDMKHEQALPHLDLEVLVMGNQQLFDHPDLPHNIDLGDVYTIVGAGTLTREK